MFHDTLIVKGYINMSKFKNAKGFTNVLIVSFAAMFGVLALALGYAAINSNTDLRSKAAEEQSIYKQWEFNSINNSNSEGWIINKPLSFITKFGWLSFVPQESASLATLSHSRVGASMPKGNKYLVFSLSAGTSGKTSPTPPSCPKPPVCADAQATIDTSTPKRAGCPVYKCLPIVRTSTPSVQRGGFGGWVQGDSVEVVDEQTVFQEAVKQKIACPIETKKCPDGSSVGRAGRSCDFMLCQAKRVIRGNVYYTKTVKESDQNRKSGSVKMEKPVEFMVPIDGAFHEVKVRLPEINDVNILTLRIEFTSGLKPGESVNLDWIRLLGVLDKKLSPTPSIVTRCIPMGECPEGAECAKPALPFGAEYCKPTPKPLISCTPRPTCLDAIRPCKMPESDDYCKPSITPKVCRMEQVKCVKAPCPKIEICDPVVVTTITPDQSYRCPATGWVDCMPGVSNPGESKRGSNCSQEYLSWAKANCPDFKGAAY